MTRPTATAQIPAPTDARAAALVNRLTPRLARLTDEQSDRCDEFRAFYRGLPLSSVAALIKEMSGYVQDEIYTQGQ